MPGDWQERIDAALAGVDLSNTSTTKFDPLRFVLSEALMASQEEIYATAVGKDFRVRFEQSADARQRPVGVAVMKDDSFLERSMDPAIYEINQGRKELVLFVSPGAEGWDTTHAIARLGSPFTSRLLQSFPDVEVRSIPVQEVRISESHQTSSEPAFSEESFWLLEQLQADPTMDTYRPLKDRLRIGVQDPFHALFGRIVARLPSTISDRMETQSRLYSKFVKNDFGRGGVWPFYWSAIYAGADRINGIQLFQWINHDRLVFGFAIGEYASSSETRFNENLSQHLDEIQALLAETLTNEQFRFGARSEELDASGIQLADWLRASRPILNAGVVLSSAEVLNSSQDELAAIGYAAFLTLFPLVLLALEDDPIAAIAAYLESAEPILPQQPAFDLARVADATGLDVTHLARWVRAIERHGQAILYGPPGTGKTYVARYLARHLIAGGDGFADLVQFHPAYTYEDFVQGLRPKPRPSDEGGGLDYPVVAGRFKVFCEEARRRSGRCVLIVDEINRANLARVFGELMYLLEYRDLSNAGGEEVIIPLAAGERFGIPPNVRMIGTMNTADRSIALVDHALRRRFAFLELSPDLDLLRSYHEGTGFPVEGLISVLNEVNNRIGDRNYSVGITFFLRRTLAADVEDIWEMQIVPYLEEYFFDEPSKVDAFRWDSIGQRILG